MSSGSTVLLFMFWHMSASASHRQSSVQARALTRHEHLTEAHLFIVFGLLAPNEHLTNSTTAAGAVRSWITLVPTGHPVLSNQAW